MRLKFWSGLFLLLSLVACASNPGRFGHYGVRGSYHGPLQCAPYARSRTGVMLRGSAASWWWKARGHYRRVYHPQPGAILVFRATRHMPYGHVSIVKKQISPHRILVEHANWVPGKIEYNAPVEDISAQHNWSRVRVWWTPIRRMGKRAYPTYGFILPAR
ncbi:CHAP domain-containing protein [Aristophania vespae]|uniref:CHAP domain-containing protein n=1 Tax=Aristophania vespae TaxID=2697033 RepID=A0A6P1NEJ7_9PROT|nr:CHAP domain-containing protein [Aristophania vespae]QHI94970.1 CHAP domain-containing protein [Aristophania vespae]UMM64134.1 hypothetical protein DM15PD_11250 [Aristophania vespae]